MDKEDVFIVVHTGIKFYPFDPSPEMVDIQDIAHSLSRECRYNGHPDEHYSVAQHSVLMAEKLVDQFYLEEAPPEVKMKALLHDAAETYVGDMPGPVKEVIGGEIKKIEEKILEVILEKYDLSTEGSLLPSSVETADKQILKLEREYIMKDSTHSWRLEDLDLHVEFEINPWSFEKSKKEFLSCFHEYQSKIKGG